MPAAGQDAMILQNGAWSDQEVPPARERAYRGLCQRLITLDLPFSHEPILRAIEERDPEAAALAHVHESNTALLTVFQAV